MKIKTIAALAFCVVVPGTSVFAGTQASISTVPASIVLAANSVSACHDKCTANHNRCKAQKRNDCYTIMQQCWNACRR